MSNHLEWTVAKDVQVVADRSDRVLDLSPDGVIDSTYLLRILTLDGDGVAIEFSHSSHLDRLINSLHDVQDVVRKYES